MRRYCELGFVLMHIDSHRHGHCSPSILAIVIPLAKKYGFKSMRISRNMGELISAPKRVIKFLVNTKIRKEFETGDLFGSYEDYIFAGAPKDKGVEVMIHPDVIDGTFVDVTENIRIQGNQLLSSIVL